MSNKSNLLWIAYEYIFIETLNNEINLEILWWKKVQLTK